MVCGDVNYELRFSGIIYLNCLVCLANEFWKQNMILILIFFKINHILFNFFKNKLYFIQPFFKKLNLEICK
jgi:hypothetical protein